MPRLKQSKPVNESGRIVEFSFNPKPESFVVRFLNGESYVVHTKNLPKRLLTKKPAWDKAVLTKDQSALCFRAGREKRLIPSHIIHARGKLLT